MTFWPSRTEQGLVVSEVCLKAWFELLALLPIASICSFLSWIIIKQFSFTTHHNKDQEHLVRQVLLPDRPVPLSGGGLEAREQQNWKSVRLFMCCGSDSNKPHMPKRKCLIQFSEPFYLVNLVSKQLNDPDKLAFKLPSWLCYSQDEQAERRNKALLFPSFTPSELSVCTFSSPPVTFMMVFLCWFLSVQHTSKHDFLHVTRKMGYFA